MQRYGRRFSALALALLAVLAAAPAALAQAPRPWEMGMQPGFSPVKREIIWLHDLVLVIITLITLFVGGLLAWCVYRYNARRNPNPSPDQPQHRARDRLDRRAGADPCRDRDPVFSPRLLPGPDARRGPDGQGHWPSVVLGIHLPGPGEPELFQLHRPG